jgi:hypothetical protein
MGETAHPETDSHPDEQAEAPGQARGARHQMQTESPKTLQTPLRFASHRETARDLQKFAASPDDFCKTFCRTCPLFTVTALRESPPVA